MSKETLGAATQLLAKVFDCRGDQELVRESLSKSLLQPNSHNEYWVAKDKDGKVIGITGLYRADNGTERKTTVWLGWFGVDPGHRKKGIGSSLLAFTIEEARRRKFKTLKLYTSLHQNEEAAHRLYEAHGFRKIGTFRDTETVYYQKDLREEEVKIMRKPMGTH